MMTAPATSSPRLAALTWLVLSAGFVSMSGCFNADRFIESRRQSAIRATQQEVELGEFRVTLPQGETYDQTTELYFRVFGRVARRDAVTVDEVLKTKEPLIRDQLLVETRKLSPEDLEEPNLTVLRKTIVEVMNAYLEGEPVQSVGFYTFRYAVF